MLGGCRMKTALLSTVCVCYFSWYVVGAQEKTGEKRRVVLLSFDGFRWDYVGRFSTPNLDSFAVEGVHAPLGIRTAFVTKTFPDHYTLVTGLYEESHGIISNKMYDPVLNASFKMGNNEPRWWDGGQPIWTTATLQGLKAGILFWPGSEVELNGVRPHRWQAFDKSVPFKDRMDTLVNWMTTDNVDLAASYFHEPDGTGHHYGVFTAEVGEKVRDVDAHVGYLINKMKEEGIYNNTDIIIVSDHGMTNVTEDDKHVIVLEDYLNWKEDVFIMPDDGALANLMPKPGKEEHVYEKLRNAHPNMTVYRKEDIPDRLHYKKHRRILPIVLLADEGYHITQKRPYREAIGPGEHGYDNNLKSMRPIFFARGPHFKAGYKVSSSFETVNIYELICHLLEIKPAANNGSITAVRDLLIENSGTLTTYGSSFPGLIISAFLWRGGLFF